MDINGPKFQKAVARGAVRGPPLLAFQAQHPECLTLEGALWSFSASRVG